MRPLLRQRERPFSIVGVMRVFWPGAAMSSQLLSSVLCVLGSWRARRACGARSRRTGQNFLAKISCKLLAVALARRGRRPAACGTPSGLFKLRRCWTRNALGRAVESGTFPTGRVLRRSLRCAQFSDVASKFLRLVAQAIEAVAHPALLPVRASCRAAANAEAFVAVRRRWASS